jgi:hypothetical protein
MPNATVEGPLSCPCPQEAQLSAAQLPFTALLAKAAAAAFNLLRRALFMPADNNARIGDRTRSPRTQGWSLTT